MNNFSIIKEGMNKFWKNPVLGLPMVFQSLISVAVLGICLLIIAAILGISVLSLTSDPESIATELLPVFMDNLGLTALVVLTCAILILLMNTFFESCLLAMINKAKPKMKDLLEGAKFFPRILLFNAVFGFVLLIIVSLIILLAALSIQNWVFGVIAGIILLIIVLLAPLFILSPFCIVIWNLSVKEAVKKSIKAVWKNYLRFFGLIFILLVISIAISLVLGFIPVIGSFLASILIGTYQRICFNLFALAKARN